MAEKYFVSMLDVDLMEGEPTNSCGWVPLYLGEDGHEALRIYRETVANMPEDWVTILVSDDKGEFGFFSDRDLVPTILANRLVKEENE